jgi:hypothetical protein
MRRGHFLANSILSCFRDSLSGAPVTAQMVLCPYWGWRFAPAQIYAY